MDQTLKIWACWGQENKEFNYLQGMRIWNTRIGKSPKHQLSLIASHFPDCTAQCSDSTLLPQGYRENACMQQASCLLLDVSKEMVHLHGNSDNSCKIHRENHNNIIIYNSIGIREISFTEKLTLKLCTNPIFTLNIQNLISQVACAKSVPLQPPFSIPSVLLQ